MSLLAALRSLCEDLAEIEEQEAGSLACIAPSYQQSALNLLHFIAFHRRNHPGLVTALRERGLSSLEGCDGHLAASLGAVIGVLEQLEGDNFPWGPLPSGPSHHTGMELQIRHSQALFGASAEHGSRVVMVTLPAEAAHHPSMILDLVQAGMDVARINCAHDNPEIWGRCIDRVKQANQISGRSCRIAMDLAGPKLRTGSLPTAPGVVDGRPRRDRYGRLVSPARLLAVPGVVPEVGREKLVGGEEKVLPILEEGWRVLEPGHRLRGRDASGRWREMYVVAVEPQGLLLSAQQRCRFIEGLRFVQEGGEGYIVVAALPQAPGERVLRVGDRLRLTAAYSTDDDAICCTCPEVFPMVKAGEPVVFDEGRIRGLIAEVHPEELHITITEARPRGSRLRADKGINLPATDLQIPSLTSKDRQDLIFAAKRADIINYSFVQSEDDLEALSQLLSSHGRGDTARVLKIETRRAFLNLPRLLLTAMRDSAPLGVMIARGDLAIECGWEALAEIQEEILRICNAAHVPCIWATQVLDSMLHHGTPTRAEITDAAMGVRAEAMMLNKGPNLAPTLQILRNIIGCMQSLLPEHGSHHDQWLSCLAFGRK